MLQNASDSDSNVTPETEMARRRRASELAELAVAKMKAATAAAEEANVLISSAFVEAQGDLLMSPKDFAALVYDRIPANDPHRDTIEYKLECEVSEQIQKRVRGAIKDATGVEPTFTAIGPISGQSMFAPSPSQSAADDSLNRSSAAAEAMVAEQKRGSECRADKEKRAAIDRMLAESPAMEGAENQTPAMQVQVRLRSGKELGMGSLSTTPEGALRFLTVTEVRGQSPAMVEIVFGYNDVELVARLAAVVPAAEPSRIVTA